MVDLDPDWQFSSEIWGLSVRLSDPKTQELAFEGTFAVSAFRDLFTRQLTQALAKKIPNGQPSGGRYISVLKNVRWGPVADRSPVLQQLRQSTDDDEVSIALNVFGYYYSDADGRHTTGAIVGCIGPRRRSEPQFFNSGRRLQSLALPTPGGQSTLIGPADARINPDDNVVIDLGHALLISDADGSITDLAKVGTALAEMKALVLGVLPDEAQKPGDRLKEGQATVLGNIDYLNANWYHRTGGLTSFPLDRISKAKALTHPLALMARMSDGDFLVLNRETQDGLFVRADKFVERLDPGGSAEIEFFFSRYGQVAPNLPLNLSFAASGNNTPAGGLTFQQTITTDQNGRAKLLISATDPGEPRPGIDGQIYALAYSPRKNAAGQPDYTGTGLNPNFDVVVAHVRTSFAIPARPEWHRDIHPIMATYAQLYPIMNRHLFKLDDYDAMAKHRRLLLLAFSRPIEDPNYMPVTRDLSKNKLFTLVKWLESETGDPANPLVKGDPAASTPVKTRRKPSFTMRQTRELGEEDVKRAMALLFAKETADVLSTSSSREGRP
jgi:hypothetical protein